MLNLSFISASSLCLFLLQSAGPPVLLNTKLFGQRVFSPFVFNATPQSQGAPRKPFAETSEHFVSLPECLFPSFEHMVHATSLTRHILSLGSAVPSQDNFSLSADYSTKAQNHLQRLGAGLSLYRFVPCVFLLCSQSIICVNTHLCPDGNRVPGWICRSKLPWFLRLSSW